jgi:hypothetical protein
MTAAVRATTRLLIALPLLALALGATAWLRYGIDLPFYDDWRGYVDGNIQSLDLNYLLRPINDTLAPVGFLLDALAQRYLGGNAVAYQLLSMLTVLGGLLYLQWKLLRNVLGDRLQAACCFSLTLLMLQPDSYWGRENLAYHQALPLVFILAAMWLLHCAREARWWHGLGLFILGLVAGFTYISGAFGALAAGSGSLIAARLCLDGEARRAQMRLAAWFTVAAGIAAVVQYRFAVMPMAGTHGGQSLAMPYQPDFWAFFLGKMGRSLALPADQPQVSIAVTLITLVVACALACLVISRAASKGSTAQEKQAAMLYWALGAMVFVYMLMVAAGRTNYRPDGMTLLLDIFVHGFSRFHFFWATLIWPWVLAVLIILCRSKASGWLKAAAFAGLVAALSAIVVRTHQHMTHYEGVAKSRQADSLCLLKGLQQDEPIYCPGLIPVRFGIEVDAYRAYAYAWNIQASFVRHYPVLPGAQRGERIPAFYQMRRIIGDIALQDLHHYGDGVLEAAGADPRVFIDTKQPEIMAACLQMVVEVDIKSETPEDFAQLYFLPIGVDRFDESHSRTVPITPRPGFQSLSFQLSSSSGFSNPLRLDPVARGKSLEVRDVRAYCSQRRG